ncbi:MAG TPA: phosphate ABC transporter permease PstA [Spirochaetales bacterium]|nr:phosphate ABC transporter permease PstA [Spirochaetales bacterium]
MRSGAKRSQAVAFGVIRFLSVLTIVILGLILGFILFKGLRYSNIERGTALAVAEREPDGFAVVVNAGRDMEIASWDELYGMFSDEYINWAKLDGGADDLLPVAVDPASADGAAVEAFLFGSEDAGGYPLWGGLVRFAPASAEALALVAATPGAVCVVPAEAARGVEGIKTLGLRRLAVALNADVSDFVGDSYLEDLSDDDLEGLFSGRIANWTELGGPDLAVAPLAPPVGSTLATVAEGSGAFGRLAGGGDDMAAYLERVYDTSGAIGPVFALDASLAGLPTAWLTRRVSGWNLSPRFILEAPRLSGKTGGISSIILNTLFMVLLTMAMAAPIGVAAAVYLVEYARDGRVLALLRLGTETLAGIPSIIFGLFGFLFFVDILGFGFGLLSGSLTLTLMILPTIVRSAEEALKAVPRSMREGSLALGATKLQTIGRVVVPAAMPGIATGVILAMGRAVGETAALIFTMGSDYQLADGLFSSARSLSTHVYLLFAEGVSFDKAFATATVLVVVVLGINLAAKRVISSMSRSGAARQGNA